MERGLLVAQLWLDFSLSLFSLFPWRSLTLSPIPVTLPYTQYTRSPIHHTSFPSTSASTLSLHTSTYPLLSLPISTNCLHLTYFCLFTYICQPIHVTSATYPSPTYPLSYLHHLHLLLPVPLSNSQWTFLLKNPYGHLRKDNKNCFKCDVLDHCQVSGSFLVWTPFELITEVYHFCLETSELRMCCYQNVD